MKIFFTAFLVFKLMLLPAYAQEDAESYTNDNLHPGEPVPINIEERQRELNPSPAEEDDPLEPFNRGVFWLNDVLDTLIFDRISELYGLVPEFLRQRVGYVLRNLSEPIVLTNNILQGEMGDAEDTLRRFLINSTVGVGGIFDISTDLGIPYKKEDFGLTLASWGVGPGLYIMLPLLGPSNLRDTFGRIGDYISDPINWLAYCSDKPLYSNARTGAQIVDAKTDNLEVTQDLKKNSIDYYASLRAWYRERRKDLILRERQALDTPRPDEED